MQRLIIQWTWASLAPLQELSGTSAGQRTAASGWSVGIKPRYQCEFWEIVLSVSRRGFILLVCLLSVQQVNDVVFSSDESHFATCSEDGSVRVWSAPSNELVVQFQVLSQVKKYTL